MTEAQRTQKSDYGGIFKRKIADLHNEGRYRTFATICRKAGQYPIASDESQLDGREITVWCSNDYLGMSPNPYVISTMHTAIDETGAGSGGRRNKCGKLRIRITPSHLHNEAVIKHPVASFIDVRAAPTPRSHEVSPNSTGWGHFDNRALPAFITGIFQPVRPQPSNPYRERFPHGPQ